MQSKLAIIRERDKYAAQLLLQTGLATDKAAAADNANRMELLRAEQEGREFEAYCLGDKLGKGWGGGYGSCIQFGETRAAANGRQDAQCTAASN